MWTSYFYNSRQVNKQNNRSIMLIKKKQRFRPERWIQKENRVKECLKSFSKSCSDCGWLPSCHEANSGVCILILTELLKFGFIIFYFRKAKHRLAEGFLIGCYCKKNITACRILWIPWSDRNVPVKRLMPAAAGLLDWCFCSFVTFFIS